MKVMQFKDVVAPKSTKDSLIQSIRDNRVAHAQLFLGPTGAGTLAMAWAYAQMVNCENPSENDSCGECAMCRRISKLEHPDMHFSFPMPGSKHLSTDLEMAREWKKALLSNPYLDLQDWLSRLKADNKQANISAGETRNIIKRLQLTPMFDGKKIMIIHLAEYLDKNGNILLKILEEPPSNTLFLLTAESEEDILVTILSRTQITRFHRLQDEEIVLPLVASGVAEEEAKQIAILANGNYAKALELVSGEGTNYTGLFRDWMAACYKNDLFGMQQWVEGFSTFGRDTQKNFLEYAISILHECLMINMGMEQLTRLQPSEKEFATSFSKFISLSNIEQITDLLQKSHYYVERNANPRILFFNVSMKLHFLLKVQKVVQAQ